MQNPAARLSHNTGTSVRAGLAIDEVLSGLRTVLAGNGPPQYGMRH